MKLIDYLYEAENIIDKLILHIANRSIAEIIYKILAIDLIKFDDKNTLIYLVFYFFNFNIIF